VSVSQSASEEFYGCMRGSRVCVLGCGRFVVYADRLLAAGGRGCALHGVHCRD